ncbi:MAG: hypothetical protein AAF433_09225 [Bacteroidota bacterium]
MRALFLLFLITSLTACTSEPTVDDKQSVEEEVVDPALEWIDGMLEAMGGLEQYQALEDVTYTYARQTADGLERLSEEIYHYPSEWSYGRYFESRNPANDQETGELTQYFAHDSTWVTFNGVLVDDPAQQQRARFVRKTNFYWLNMFFKLRDPGLTYELGEERELYGQTYQTLSVSFEEGVGDAKDIYLLYLNTETKLVDYFLYTVMEFDHPDPSMMKIDYAEVGGLLWPVRRAAVSSNWEGELPEDADFSLARVIEGLQVNTGAGKGLFE